MNATVRIYGRAINTWYNIKEKNGREVKSISQQEIEYKEYDLNGNLVNCGTEDFSSQRYANEIEYPSVYTWDGKTLNKGGYRKFEYRGSIKFLKGQRNLVKEFLKTKYSETEIVQLRA